MATPQHGKSAFFKYYTAEAVKLTLQNTSIKWSTPLLFNDPFDNQFDLYYEEPNDLFIDDQLRQFLETITSPEPLRPNQFGPKTEIMEFIRQVHMQNPDIKYTEDELAYLRSAVIEGMQRVIAITPQASAEIRKVMADTSVFYLSETRDNLWAYEKEWRLVSSLRDKTQSYEIIPCYPEEIGAVYLGCKMADGDKAKVIEITRSKYKHTKILEAKKHPNEFALIFAEIIL